MTREEAIARIRNHKIAHKMNEPRAIFISEALDMAIDALEHEKELIDALGLSLHVQSLNNSILEEEKHKLDKIRAEINAMFPPSGTWMYEEGHEVEHAICEVLFDVLQIIDKYRGKQNE